MEQKLEHPLATWMRLNRVTAARLGLMIGRRPEHISRLCSGSITIGRVDAMAIIAATNGGVTLADWGLV